MTGANSVVGLWRDLESDTVQDEDSAALVDAETYHVEEELPDPSMEWGEKLGIAALVILGIGWVGAVGFDRFTALGSGPLTLSFAIDAIVAVSTPLALILIGWIAIDYRRQKQRLRELDAEGVVRRSGRGAADI